MTAYLQKLRHIFRQVDFTLLLVASVTVGEDVSNFIQLTSET